MSLVIYCKEEENIQYIAEQNTIQYVVSRSNSIVVYHWVGVSSNFIPEHTVRGPLFCPQVRKTFHLTVENNAQLAQDEETTGSRQYIFLVWSECINIPDQNQNDRLMRLMIKQKKLCNVKFIFTIHLNNLDNLLHHQLYENYVFIAKQNTIQYVVSRSNSIVVYHWVGVSSNFIPEHTVRGPLFCPQVRKTFHLTVENNAQLAQDEETTGSRQYIFLVWSECINIPDQNQNDRLMRLMIKQKKLCNVKFIFTIHLNNLDNLLHHQLYDNYVFCSLLTWSLD